MCIRDRPIEEPSMGTLALGPAGQWNMYSFYGTRSSNPLSGGKQVRIDFDNGNQAGTIWFDDFVMLDLTEIFGAGHEPSKEWCDLNIVSGTTSQTVAYDANATLNLKDTSKIAAGYTFKGWSTVAKTSSTQQTVNYADGATINNITNAGGSITLYGVWEQNQVPITVTSGANGTITPGSTTVGWGDSASFVVKANDKYKIDTLTVDGSPVNFNPNNASYVTEYTLTLNDVRSAHLIEATFVEIVSLTIDVQNELYRNSVYIYHTDYDSTNTTTEEVFFYIKPLPGLIFKGWANRNGEIVSTNPFETFEFVKDNAYYFYAVLEVAPEREYYSINLSLIHISEPTRPY